MKTCKSMYESDFHFLLILNYLNNLLVLIGSVEYNCSVQSALSVCSVRSNLRIKMALDIFEIRMSFEAEKVCKLKNFSV